MLIDINFRIFPVNTTVSVGASAVFLCLSNQDVIWEFNDGILPINVKTEKRATEYISNWLSIPEVQQFNEGTYTCSAYYRSTLIFEDKAYLNIKSIYIGYMISIIIFK